MATFTGTVDNDFFLGTAGSDTFLGKAGYDTASYTNSKFGITVRLYASFAQDTGFGTDTLSSIESIYASNYADVVYGNDTDNNYIRGFSGADKLFGLGGSDWLDGGIGNDRLYGGFGIDTLEGGAGDDYLSGGAGNDRVTYGDATKAVAVDLAKSLAQSTGWGLDRLVSIEDLYGSKFNDRLYGSGSGNFISGAQGSDLLMGRAGADELRGYDGADRLNGGPDKDTLTGGAGVDRFIFSSASHSVVGSEQDVITDFNEFVDLIDVRQIDALPSSAGNEAFTWLGSADFTGAGGELRFWQTSLFIGDTMVSGDTDGDRLADVQIKLEGLHDLDIGQFLL